MQYPVCMRISEGEAECSVVLNSSGEQPLCWKPSLCRRQSRGRVSEVNRLSRQLFYTQQHWLKLGLGGFYFFKPSWKFLAPPQCGRSWWLSNRQHSSRWETKHGGLEKLQALFTEKLQPKLYVYCQVYNFTARLFLFSSPFTVALCCSLNQTLTMLRCSISGPHLSSPQYSISVSVKKKEEHLCFWRYWT